ncbi:MAG: (Fe-S)-binding protein [Candidatus Thermoplasmatota archaeon]
MATKTNTKSKRLKEYEEQMNMCIRCAYCFEQCPVIKENQWDTEGARGKIIMSYGILTGDLKPSQYIADKLFRCTFCRDCIERCPSSLELLEIFSNARAALVDAGFASDTHEYVIDNIKKTGNIYGDEEVITQEKEGKTPLFVGCQYLSRPNKTKKYIKILEKLGIEPTVVEEVCCGFPMDVLGFKDEYSKHKDRFKEKFPFKDAVALCPTCTVFLKEGYEIKSKHVLKLILEKIPSADLDLKATYHDPCDFSRGLKIIDEPRQILKKLGVEIVEMKNNKENSRCCGGGGGVLMTDQDLSNDIAKKRIHEALETGVDMLITSCPTCETTLKKAAQEISESEGRRISVRNIEDIIWKGLRNAKNS